jgi:predicted DNA-binding transcriptional regulator YafY
VRIRYHARGEETVRTVDPYGVVCHEEYWYTVGWCHLRQDIRVFRVDRILDVAIEEETFARPPGFESLRYVLDTIASAPWGWEIEVLLDATFEHVRRRVPPGSALLEATPDGVVLRGRIEDLDWLARQLLTLECSFVVRQPNVLRVALRRLAVEVATLADGVEDSSSR